MTSQVLALVIVGVACLLPRPAVSHGRMFNPRGRTSCWRDRQWKQQFGLINDYQDMEGFCGGRGRQISNGYRCGVCGDPWDAPAPREKEVGGRLVRSGPRPIVASYTPGQVATFTVEITANHLGWVSFKLCPVNDFTVEATQDCLDAHPVKLHRDFRNIEIRPDVYDKYRYNIGVMNGHINVDVIIPRNLVCSLCVMQWRYHTGNSYGPNPETGASEPGAGPQEEFYTCSDVTISGSGLPPPQVPATTTTTTTTRATTTTTTPHAPGPVVTPSGGLDLSDCLAVGPWESNGAIDTWCRNNCISPVSSHCPEFMCNDACRELARTLMDLLSRK